MQRTILVTGGTGTLGRALVERFAGGRDATVVERGGIAFLIVRRRRRGRGDLASSFVIFFAGAGALVGG